MSPRLHRSSTADPGIIRRRCGRGFTYVRSTDESRVTDDEALARIQALVIPPAWQSVWISEDPLGHLQAVGTDDAGRRQYLYHERWRERSQRRSWSHVAALAERLPDLRARIDADLAASDTDERTRAIAACVKLIDMCALRVGSPDYVARHGTHGATTLLRRHVRLCSTPDADTIRLHFPGKHGSDVRHCIVDAAVAEHVRVQRRYRARGGELFRYRSGGRHWHCVSAAQVNDYLREATCEQASARLMRRWHASLIYAAHVAAQLDASAGDEPGNLGRLTKGAVRRASKGAIASAAGFLVNTPAVCRSSYLHPALLDKPARVVRAAPQLATLDFDERSRDHRAWLAVAEPAVLQLIS